MNDLRQYFESNNGRLIDKYTHYFDIYERHLSRYRNQAVHFVEIGVFQGGSLQMWKHYFGPKAHIYGVDINPECKKFEENQIQVFIGDQADRHFLRELRAKLPRIDIVLDDGGHLMHQQIATFEVLYPAIAEDGVYLCEDLHTSYFGDCGGGFRSRGTFIEYSKYFIDYLNGWHFRFSGSPAIERFARSTYSLNYYDSMLVIEKRQVPGCERKTTGKLSFQPPPPPGLWQRARIRLPQLLRIWSHKLTFRPYHRSLSDGAAR